MRRHRLRGTLAAATLIASLAAVLSLPPPSLAKEGELDLTFGVAGLVSTSVFSAGPYPLAMGANLLQPDGRLVLGGTYGSDFANRFALMRYASDGQLDASFDGDGVANPALGALNFGSIFGLALQADGRLIAVGMGAAAGEFSGFAVARFNANGSLDPSFDGDGFTVTHFGSEAYAARSVAVQPDGKIVVVGGDWGASGSEDMLASRYNPDGSLDTTFDGDGMWRASETPGTLGAGLAVSVQPGGKLLIGGAIDGGLAVLRLNADGSADRSFGTSGRTVLPFDPYQGSPGFHFYPDGRILVAGIATTGTLGVARLRADGTSDPTFGQGGILRLALASSNDAPRRIAVQADGRILISALHTISMSYFSAAVWRLLPNGDVDRSFGESGRFEYAYPPAALTTSLSPGDVVVRPDGKLLVVAYREGAPFAAIVLLRINSAAPSRLSTGPPERIFDSRSGPRLARGAVTRLTAGAPTGATAALVNLTMTDAVGAGYVTADRCSAIVVGPQTKSSGNFAVGRDTANLAVVPLDSDGSFCVYNDQPVHIAVDRQGFYGSGGAGDLFTPSAPRRLIDTRANGSRLRAGSITRIRTETPAGASAALVNITMTDAAAPGYITADRCSTLISGPQTKSNGNYPLVLPVANLAVVPIDADGSFCIYSDQPVHLIADIQGSYSPAGLILTVLAPARILDTRSSPDPVAAGSITRVTTNGLRAAMAALVNLTMTDAATAGYITADRCSALTKGPQTKSNGNFVAGRDAANLAVVPLDDDGSFCIYNDQAVHFAVDLVGAY